MALEEIYLGTSGWSYPRGLGRWTGVFYPPGADELTFYSRYFNAVEVNVTFYRLVSPKVSAGWVAKTPADFCFAVKLWQKFTHPEMYREETGTEALISQEDVDAFKASLEPLASQGKLGCVLAQFPPSFKREEETAAILGEIARLFAEYPLSVELRHRSWSDDPETTELLRAHDISWCVIDEPRFRSSVSPDVPSTSSVAYFRFHGRNAADWWKGDRERRYDYRYSLPELAQLEGRIRDVGEAVRRAFVFFNNHFGGQAVVNALQLKMALGLSVPELPPQLLVRYPELAER